MGSICPIWSEQDDNDDDDDDDVPLYTLYECQSYFKRIRDFALAQNNSEELVYATRWSKKLENRKLASMNEAKQSSSFLHEICLSFISCFYILIKVIPFPIKF